MRVGSPPHLLPEPQISTMSLLLIEHMLPIRLQPCLEGTVGPLAGEVSETKGR